MRPNIIHVMVWIIVAELAIGFVVGTIVLR